MPTDKQIAENSFIVKKALIGFELYNMDGEPISDRATVRRVIDGLSKYFPPLVYVYVGYSRERKLWKIGLTREPNRRSAQLDIDLRYILPCEGDRRGRIIERCLHIYFRNKHTKGEWFAELSSDDLKVLEPFIVKMFRPLPDCVPSGFTQTLLDALDREEAKSPYWDLRGFLQGCISGRFMRNSE